VSHRDGGRSRQLESGSSGGGRVSKSTRSSVGADGRCVPTPLGARYDTHLQSLRQAGVAGSRTLDALAKPLLQGDLYVANQAPDGGHSAGHQFADEPGGGSSQRQHRAGRGAAAAGRCAGRDRALGQGKEPGRDAPAAFAEAGVPTPISSKVA
jgi:hypothetical protein